MRSPLSIKLLIYSHFFAPSVGGVETVVLDLARGLSDQTRPGDSGPRHFAITLATQTPRGDFEDALLPFRVIRQPTSWGLKRLIQEADLIHVAGAAMIPILYGLLARKPVIVEHHGFQYVCPTGQLFQEPQNWPCPGHFTAGRHSFCLRCSSNSNRLRSIRLWLLTFVRRFLLNRVQQNITPTDWLAKQLQLPRSVTVHHGLKASPALVRIARPEGPFVFVFVGRLVTSKGLRVLLEACKILIEQKVAFRLIVIGDGPERSTLETTAHEWNLLSHVQFLGRMENSRVIEALEKSDVVISPSLAGEVFGMVVAENMQRGIPVLASDLGAFAEVAGEAGFMFRTGDAVDLARQMARIADDPAHTNHVAALARQRVLNCFSTREMVERHAAVYMQLANEANLRSRS